MDETKVTLLMSPEEMVKILSKQIRGFLDKTLLKKSLKILLIQF